MGYIKHHSIIVTSWDDKLFNEAHKKASLIFNNLCSEKIIGVLNGYNSFFIAPDGSKEGWSESNIGNVKRTEFINWIEKQSDEDGSNSISYVELFFGEDNGESQITAHN